MNEINNLIEMYGLILSDNPAKETCTKIVYNIEQDIQILKKKIDKLNELKNEANKILTIT